MLKPLGFAICPLVALAVVASGCGSTKMTTTSTIASTPTTASTPYITVPESEGAQTATQSKGSTHAPRTTTGHAQAPVTTQPPGNARSPLLHKKIESRNIEPQPKVPPGLRYEYPLEAQRGFMASCIARNSSKSSCECIIEEYEKRNVPEEGISLSEMLATEVALKNGLPLAPRARVFAKQCKGTL